MPLLATRSARSGHDPSARTTAAILYDRPLTRSSHVLGSTAAFLVSAGLLVVWLSPDVCGFRPVLARGWHGPCLRARSIATSPSSTLPGGDGQSGGLDLSPGTARAGLPGPGPVVQRDRCLVPRGGSSRSRRLQQPGMPHGVRMFGARSCAGSAPRLPRNPATAPSRLLSMRGTSHRRGTRTDLARPSGEQVPGRPEDRMHGIRTCTG